MVSDDADDDDDNYIDDEDEGINVFAIYLTITCSLFSLFVLFNHVVFTTVSSRSVFCDEAQGPIFAMMFNTTCRKFDKTVWSFSPKTLKTM